MASRQTAISTGWIAITVPTIAVRINASRVVAAVRSGCARAGRAAKVRPSRHFALQLRSFCGLSSKAAPWQERNPEPAISAAMTNHVVLAGSVLAAVSLWAAVYTALLPKHAPALPAAEVSVATRVPDTQPEQGTPSPRRWVDLPREEPRPSVVPATADNSSAADLLDAGHPRKGHRVSQRRIHQIRRAALPDVLVERHFVRERAFAPRRVRARVR